jgi:serine/threonine protein kinase
LLFGVLPFEIRYMQDFAKITHQEVSFPKGPAVSQEAKSFIAQCLAKEPGERMTIKEALDHSFLARKQNDFKIK